jgi:hypothetical protein
MGIADAEREREVTGCPDIRNAYEKRPGIVTTGGLRSWRMGGGLFGAASKHRSEHRAGRPVQKLSTTQRYAWPVFSVGILMLATAFAAFATFSDRMNV